MEIVRQADAFGLPTPERTPAPPPERVAEQLAPAVPWSGPLKVGTETPDPGWGSDFSDDLSGEPGTTTDTGPAPWSEA